MRAFALAIGLLLGSASLAPSPVLAGPPPGCLYKQCPVHGRVSCDHECEYVSGWVPQQVDDGAPATATATQTPPDPKAQAAIEKKKADEAEKKRAAEQADDAARKSAATTKARGESDAAARDSARSLSGEMRKGNAWEQAVETEEKTNGALSFPRKPMDSPGDRHGSVVGATGRLPIPGRKLTPETQKQVDALETQRAALDGKIAEAQRALDAVPPADPKRSDLARDLQTLKSQQGTIVIDMDDLKAGRKPASHTGTR